LYGAGTWTLRKVDYKYLKSLELWWWRRMEKISWTNCVRKGVLHGVKKERNILHTVQRRKVDWIGHILRRKCILKHIIEGKIEGGIEMMGKRKRRRK
jgi:hypothetical protein